MELLFEIFNFQKMAKRYTSNKVHSVKYRWKNKGTKPNMQENLTQNRRDIIHKDNREINKTIKKIKSI